MERFRLIAGVAILCFWGFFLILSSINPDVQVDPGLTAAALAVVTFLFGLTVVDKIKKNGNRNGS